MGGATAQGSRRTVAASGTTVPYAHRTCGAHRCADLAFVRVEVVHRNVACRRTKGVASARELLTKRSECDLFHLSFQCLSVYILLEKEPKVNSFSKLNVQ